MAVLKICNILKILLRKYGKCKLKKFLYVPFQSVVLLTTESQNINVFVVYRHDLSTDWPTLYVVLRETF